MQTKHLISSYTTKLLFILSSIIVLSGCINKQKSNTVNKMECKDDFCEIPSQQTQISYYATPKEDKPIHITYFTDPICSSCWGIEPQLRRLKLEYGKYVHIDYRMGGLLKDWNYSSASINKPSDVAGHWDEVSPYYKMPIDGDIWLEDPLDSSYPPSIAFKAAQMQDEQKAYFFLRVIREMVFIQKKNITKTEYLVEAAKAVNLDVEQFKKDYTDGTAEQKFKEDLALARKIGVRGFPTLLLNNNEGKEAVVYGFKPYNKFQSTIKDLLSEAKPEDYDTSWEALFEVYPSLTTQEFTLLSKGNRDEGKDVLENLYSQDKLTQISCKNGVVWRKK